jgi:ABC-type glycerol-3-phosphate transport system permease component
MSAIAMGTPGRRGRGPARTEAGAPLRAATIIIYGTLIFAAIYYLIPLYVMIVTSLKGCRRSGSATSSRRRSRSPSSPG